MNAHLTPYRTPVFEDFGTHGDGWGSGSYLRMNDRRFILTNEHVATIRHKGRKLAHQFNDHPDFYQVVGNHAEVGWPEDLALLPVSNAAWTAKPHTSAPIEMHQLAIKHAPVEGEMLAFVGFAGANAHFVFNTLNVTSTTLVTREVPVTPDPGVVDPAYHFGLDYRPDTAVQTLGTGGLPLPPGLSGSTVWNTRYVETAMSGGVWTPDLAQVTGVVWGWPSSQACLVATRVEYLHPFLSAAATHI